MDHSPQSFPQLRITLVVSLLLALLITPLAIASAFAQIAVVTQPVYLQADPSTDHLGLAAASVRKPTVAEYTFYLRDL
jgi:hypothetical protein